MIGPKVRKIYRRNLSIFFTSIVLMFIVISAFYYFNLGKLGFWLIVPLWVTAVVAWLGLFSFGPLKKGFKEAIETDEKEQIKKLQTTQPWEK